MDYEIHIRAVYDGTAGPYSIVHTVPFLDPPARPRKLAASRSADGVNISWKKSKDGSITRYETRWAHRGEEILLKEWNTVGLATSAKIAYDGSNHGRQWKIQVRAVNASGNSKIARLMSKPPEAETPGNFSAKAVEGQNVKLEWTQTDPHEVSGWEYRVKSGSVRSQWKKLSGVTAPEEGSNFSATVAGSSPCAPCTYHIRAFNDADRSPLARDKAYNQKPTWIAGISQARGTDRVTLSWEESNIDLTGYQYRLNFGTWKDISLDQVTANGDDRSWILTGLTSGTTYLLEIRAVNGVGAGQSTVETVATQ